MPTKMCYTMSQKLFYSLVILILANVSSVSMKAPVEEYFVVTAKDTLCDNTYTLNKEEDVFTISNKDFIPSPEQLLQYDTEAPVASTLVRNKRSHRRNQEIRDFPEQRYLGQYTTPKTSNRKHLHVSRSRPYFLANNNDPYNADPQSNPESDILRKHVEWIEKYLRDSTSNTTLPIVGSGNTPKESPAIGLTNSFLASIGFAKRDQMLDMTENLEGNQEEQFTKWLESQSQVDSNQHPGPTLKSESESDSVEEWDASSVSPQQHVPQKLAARKTGKLVKTKSKIVSGLKTQRGSKNRNQNLHRSLKSSHRKRDTNKPLVKLNATHPDEIVSPGTNNNSLDADGWNHTFPAVHLEEVHNQTSGLKAKNVADATTGKSADDRSISATNSRAALNDFLDYPIQGYPDFMQKRQDTRKKREIPWTVSLRGADDPITCKWTFTKDINCKNLKLTFFQYENMARNCDEEYIDINGEKFCGQHSLSDSVIASKQFSIEYVRKAEFPQLLHFKAVVQCGAVWTRGLL